MITLYNVVDIRTGKHHSKAIVSEKNARYFVHYVEETTEEIVEEGGDPE